jgi:hypothetical protein
MQRYWDPASIEYQFDIDMKIDEGRGRIGGVGPELPQEILKLNPSYPEWKIAPRKNNDKTNEGN